MHSADTTMDWEFRGANTKRLTHCFHPYPAMFIPQVAGRLIDSYGQGARVLLDPYCGAGTALVEANLRDINAIGSDLNPLARLIATAKTSKVAPAKIARRLRDICNIQKISGMAQIPDLQNIDFWFSPEVQQDLAALHSHIYRMRDGEARRFFLVVLSETIRACSYTRNGEFKLYRMAEEQRDKFQPNVFKFFMERAERNYAGLQEFAGAVNGAKSRIYDFNSVHSIPADIVRPESVDIVVTSPPYGDSATTVAYGQFSRLANEWMGYKNARAVDRELMGGIPPKSVSPLGEKSLNAAVRAIEKECPKRAAEVCGFYRDYRSSIENVAATVRPGGVVCYVVGNRKVKGVVLPTDRATAAYFQENGFEKEAVFTRNIPNKRMPSRNSPSNAPGASDVTMCFEHIVVMRKM